MSEVEAADLLIFTTPTYCMRASALFSDWLMTRELGGVIGVNIISPGATGGLGLC